MMYCSLTDDRDRVLSTERRVLIETTDNVQKFYHFNKYVLEHSAYSTDLAQCGSFVSSKLEMSLQICVYHVE
jgi:hypothetical protein